jgi:hypothetical protein
MKKVFQIFVVVFLMLVNPGLVINLSGQNNNKLPGSTPESQGVSSAGIVDFLNAVDTGRVELHSFMFIRHCNVIAEGWWIPYDAWYACTSSYTIKRYTYKDKLDENIPDL